MDSPPTESKMNINKSEAYSIQSARFRIHLESQLERIDRYIKTNPEVLNLPPATSTSPS